MRSAPRCPPRPPAAADATAAAEHLHSDGGGGDRGPDTYMDLKLEYQPDGSRRKVDLDAPEDPALRYEASPLTPHDPALLLYPLLMVAGLVQVVNMRDMPVREHHVTANFPLEILKDSDVRPSPSPFLSFLGLSCLLSHGLLPCLVVLAEVSAVGAGGAHGLQWRDPPDPRHAVLGHPQRQPDPFRG